MHLLTQSKERMMDLNHCFLNSLEILPAAKQGKRELDICFEYIEYFNQKELEWPQEGKVDYFTGLL